jgi:hypothetical protein
MAARHENAGQQNLVPSGLHTSRLIRNVPSQILLPFGMTVAVGPLSPWSHHMSKRKPARTSKRARSPKIAAQAQRNKQDIVRSAKDTPLRSVAKGPIEPPAELQYEPPQTVIAPKLPIKDRTTLNLQDGINGPSEKPDYSIAAANMLAYQTNMLAYQMTLLEMTHANMRLAFEFSQRLATIRTPYELLDVIFEFTYKRFYLVSKLL